MKLKSLEMLWNDAAQYINDLGSDAASVEAVEIIEGIVLYSSSWSFL